MSKLKIYGGGFDGTHRYIVRTTSWKDATALFNAAGLNMSLNAARSYGSISENQEERRFLATTQRQVFRRPLDDHSGKWEPVP